jgi:glycosyltransferase involved in cell wall biosynthesis
MYPLVSIICPTYNHELFITQALEGFLMQKTNFSFEIIVHDDASSDETPKIVKEYELKFPNLFSNIYQNENQFSKYNTNVSRIMFSKARGKYFALCEGDDFWTDPYKLQKQVDFLESNLAYVGCIHDAKFIGLIEYYPQNKFTAWLENEKIDIQTIFQRGGGCYPTASFVFRRPENIFELNLFMKSYIAGDSALIYYLLKFGDFYHLKEQMCVYRVHKNGVYTSKIHNPFKLIEMEYNNIELLKATKRHLKQYYSFINNGISICINNILEQAFKSGSSRAFSRVFILVTKYSPIILPFFNYRNLFYLSSIFVFRKVKYRVRKFSNLFK